MSSNKSCIGNHRKLDNAEDSIATNKITLRGSLVLHAVHTHLVGVGGGDGAAHLHPHKVGADLRHCSVMQGCLQQCHSVFEA